jgi:hypothetical protein
METPVAEQQQLRAALDAALAATTDFGIRKLKDPAGSLPPIPRRPLNSLAGKSGRTVSRGARMSCARLMRWQACL